MLLSPIKKDQRGKSCVFTAPLPNSETIMCPTDRVYCRITYILTSTISIHVENVKRKKMGNFDTFWSFKIKVLIEIGRKIVGYKYIVVTVCLLHISERCEKRNEGWMNEWQEDRG